MTLGVLASFAGDRGPTSTARLHRLADDGVPVVWDSGAWSVLNGTATIDPSEHARWVSTLPPTVRAIGLDVIGDPAGTLANYRAQRPVASVEPTIHYGEPLGQLDALLDVDPEPGWVCIGGLVAASRDPAQHRNIAGFIAAIRKRVPASTFYLAGAGANRTALEAVRAAAVTSPPVGSAP